MSICNKTLVLECMYKTNKLKMHLKKGANKTKNYKGLTHRVITKLNPSIPDEVPVTIWLFAKADTVNVPWIFLSNVAVSIVPVPVCSWFVWGFLNKINKLQKKLITLLLYKLILNLLLLFYTFGQNLVIGGCLSWETETMLFNTFFDATFEGF